MSKINNKRKTQKEKKIRKENDNQKVGGQRKEIINENKATDFYYLTVLYLEFQLVRTPPPLPNVWSSHSSNVWVNIKNRRKRKGRERTVGEYTM